MKKILLISIFLLFASCQRYAAIEKFLQKYPSDNPLEEAIEDYIKEKCGEDIDLSIFSKENKEETH